MFYILYFVNPLIHTDLFIGTLNQFNSGKCNTIKFLIATVIYLYILIMSSKGVKRKNILDII